MKSLFKKNKCTCCGECRYFCRTEDFADSFLTTGFEPFAMCVKRGEVHHKDDAPCRDAKRA